MGSVTLASVNSKQAWKKNLRSKFFFSTDQNLKENVMISDQVKPTLIDQIVTGLIGQGAEGLILIERNKHTNSRGILTRNFARRSKSSFDS